MDMGFFFVFFLSGENVQELEIVMGAYNADRLKHT